MNDKKHLTEEGLIRIMSIRVKMNKKTLITSYDGPLIDRDVPIVPSLNKSDITSDWLTGFTVYTLTQLGRILLLKYKRKYK